GHLLFDAHRVPTSAPVAVDEDPATGAAVIVGRYPLRAAARPGGIVAFDPYMLATVPAPVARLPDVDLGPFVRQHRNDLAPHRRRLVGDDDFLGKGGERYDAHTCGAKACSNGEAAQQAATVDVLHRSISSGCDRSTTIPRKAGCSPPWFRL